VLLAQRPLGCVPLHQEASSSRLEFADINAVCDPPSSVMNSFDVFTRRYDFTAKFEGIIISELVSPEMSSGKCESGVCALACYAVCLTVIEHQVCVLLPQHALA